MQKNDGLRNWAIASQALGFSLIVWLESSSVSHAGRWQAVVLGLMLAAALGVLLVRRYRENRARRAAEHGSRRRDDAP